MLSGPVIGCILAWASGHTIRCDADFNRHDIGDSEAECSRIIGSMLLQTPETKRSRVAELTENSTQWAAPAAAAGGSVAPKGSAAASISGTAGAVSGSTAMPAIGTEVITAQDASAAVPACLTNCSLGITPTGVANATLEESSVSLFILRLFPKAHHLLIGFDLLALVKMLCIIGNLIFQVSPLPQVKRWQSKGCSSSEDAAPYVSIAFAGCQWCFYGAFAFCVTGRSGFLVLVHSNCVGALLGMYYVFSFSRYCRHANLLEQLRRYMSVGAALVLFQLACIAHLPAERALFLSGLVSSLCSVMSASALLVTIPVVIQTRDSASIPGPLVFAALFSAVCWCVCGWLLDDPMVMGPNFWAIVCATTSLAVKFKYSSPGQANRGRAIGAEKGDSRPGCDCGEAEFTPPASLEPVESPAQCKKCGPTSELPRSAGTGGTH
eukprot:TRINITY_DN5380_c0_g1_i2.p1 TRINITY_DN5380_c0_g1~~TRINITY_DN5380_c0_g1_i2.p1  ORF type:complete len:437 (+),score=49.08 TRINITY_DN5380_c0_g1_i2:67-1377(+)